MKAFLVGFVSIIVCVLAGWLILRGLSKGHQESALNMHPSFFKKEEIVMTQKINQQHNKRKVLNFLEHYEEMKEKSKNN